MVLGGSGGRELAVLFVYLDPDVLPAGFRGRSQRGAAAGEGVEDQGAGDGSGSMSCSSSATGFSLGWVRLWFPTLAQAIKSSGRFPGSS